MEISRIRLKLKGSYITPWQADTIFGHICWVVLKKEGPDSFADFIEPFVKGNPPFVISNAFPGDLIPVPLNLFSRDELRKVEEVGLSYKQVKKVSWIKLSDLVGVLDKGWTSIDELNLKRKPIVYHRRYGNAINRRTGTTGIEGALFEIEEAFLNDRENEYLSIYVKAESEWIKRFVKLFEMLSYEGFGKKRTSGRGSFEMIDLYKFDGFPEIKNANAFLSLSNFVPSTNDPTEGLYKILIKYGKLGEDFATSGMQFKKPLVMFEAGSVFKTDGPPREFYGRMVKGLVSGMPEVVQYGYAFPVPIRI